jgi:pSer/pThr/pTyr-binding forkhead associated (FHA) protein
MPRLKIVTPKVALDVDFGRAITIGRHVANSLPLPDAEISRRHAQIFPRGEEFLIADLGSRNGLYVNGEKTKECALKPGDEVALGLSLLFYDPPEGEDLAELLSARGRTLWSKLPQPEKFMEFEVTTFGRSELQEMVTKWLHRSALPPLLPANLQAKFLEFALGLGRAAEPAQLPTGVLDFLQERVGGERVALMRADRKKKELQVQCVTKGSAAEDFEIGKDVLRIAVDGEKGVFCPDCATDFRFCRLTKQSNGAVGSFVAAPIFRGADYYGFFYADRPPGRGSFDLRSLVQAHLAAELFGNSMHWLPVGAAGKKPAKAER